MLASWLPISILLRVTSPRYDTDIALGGYSGYSGGGKRPSHSLSSKLAHFILGGYGGYSGGGGGYGGYSGGGGGYGGYSKDSSLALPCSLLIILIGGYRKADAAAAGAAPPKENPTTQITAPPAETVAPAAV